jgi:hypothetical protein
MSDFNIYIANIAQIPAIAFFSTNEKAKAWLLDKARGETFDVNEASKPDADAVIMEDIRKAILSMAEIGRAGFSVKWGTNPADAYAVWQASKDINERIEGGLDVFQEGDPGGPLNPKPIMV